MDHHVARVIPGIVLIGGDGGNTTYGFRWTHDSVDYIETDLIGTEPEGVRHFTSFADMLEQLAAD